jgi:hypothetical protein
MRSTFTKMLCVALLLSATTSAFAQGSSSSLSGSVVDAGGGVIPGATVVVKNNATAVSQTVVTNSTGAFALPALAVGTYTVTVSLTGFKTAVINDVRLVSATPAQVTAKLEVGTLSETVEVTAGADLVQTQSATVTSTIKMEQLSELPLVSRNTLYAVAFLPGVETGGGPRAATINGLPQNTINITIDGISTGNPLQSTDGFFSMVTPRLDAVEEITVTGAVPGSGGGQGSTQVSFVTRAGTNSYESSIYEYMRRPYLNSNAYFNKVNGLARNEVIVDQYGGRVGGPIQIPGIVDGRGKAFFFFNFEHQHQPNSATRTRTILNPQARQGDFTYLVSGATQTRNIMAIAAANGQTSTFDPTIAALLDAMRASTSITGVVNTPANAFNTQSFVYQATTAGDQYAPTSRIDFNLTTNHRLTGSYWWQRFKSNPDLLNNADPQFPGFPNFGTQNSYRTTGAIALRSTLGSNLVNEARAGWQWSPNEFFTNVTADMFANQGGFNLDIPTVSDVTSVAAPAPRNTTNINFENTLNWLRGSHSYSMGGGYVTIYNLSLAQTVVPSATVSFNTANDPSNGMFNTTNFPGASGTQLTEARNLYALLTGRVTSIGGTGRLDANTGKYVYNGDLKQRAKMSSIYGFAQDTWKLKPNFTVNLGLRYEVQLPWTPITDTYSRSNLASICGISGLGDGVGGRGCNIFQPSLTPAAPGALSQYTRFAPGDKGFETDWNNLAPNVGFAWQPRKDSGLLRAILGDPDQATIRAGYGWSFNLERIDRYTFGNNPGGTTNATRNVANGNLIEPGGSWPLLLRETNRLGPPPVCTTTVSAACMAGAISYPITATSANSVNIFDADIQTPHVESWSIGFQRSLDRNTAVEVRYLGNRNKDAWTAENWNERVMFENGFMNEFQSAMANLKSHVQAGCSAAAGNPVGPCSYAYRGAGTGTSPLPTYLAYFLGRADASNAAAYTGANWTNTAYTGDLSPLNPNPNSTAGDLAGDATFRTNALTAGLAQNFWTMNPNIGGANVTRSLTGDKYNALQLEIRRRLSNGLLVQASYSYSAKKTMTTPTLRRDRFFVDSLTNNNPHSFKMNWVYEIPVGRGRRFGPNMHAVLNGILGGWQYSGTGIVRTTLFNAGSVDLVGMSQQEAQGLFKIRIERSAEGTTTVFSMPQDVIDNTRRAFNTDPTAPSGYGADGAPSGRYFAPSSEPGCIAVYAGDCGAPTQLLFRGPAFVRFDMRIKKSFALVGKTKAEFDIEVLNVFNNINFNHAMNPGGGTGIFQVTSSYTDINTTFDPGGRLGQMVFRVTF